MCKNSNGGFGTMNVSRNRILFIVLLFTVFPFFNGYSKDHDPHVSLSQQEKFLRDFVPEGVMKDEAVIGSYIVRTYRNPNNGGSFEILKSDERVWAQYGWSFQIGGRGNIHAWPDFNLVGEDLTGDGNANLVIYEWSGGAHCCFTMQLFDVSEEFELITEINGRDGVPKFFDWNQDGVAEIMVSDMSYAYFPGSFADSPAPTVVLKWHDGSYIPDMEWMSKPITNMDEFMEEFHEYARQVKDSEVWTSGPNGEYSRYHIPEDLFGFALCDLMYKGHEELGWKFIREAWTDKFPVDEELLDEFRERMESSPYWQELKEEYQAAIVNHDDRLRSVNALQAEVLDEK
jgi:hypothetical protein